MSKSNSSMIFAALVLSVGLFATPVEAQMTNSASSNTMPANSTDNAGQAANPSSATAPDNTAVNARDRNAGEETADQGGNKLTDRQLMQGIRKAVVKDKSLSTYAHNVKIVALNGKVTLKGPVETQDEVQNIQAKAEQVAGEGNVTNKLSVKNP